MDDEILRACVDCPTVYFGGLHCPECNSQGEPLEYTSQPELQIRAILYENTEKAPENSTPVDVGKLPPLLTNYGINWGRLSAGKLEARH